MYVCAENLQADLVVVVVVVLVWWCWCGGVVVLVRLVVGVMKTIHTQASIRTLLSDSEAVDTSCTSSCCSPLPVLELVTRSKPP